MVVARLDAEELRVGVDEIAAHFRELEDPRSTVNRRHPRVSGVVIAIMAVLAGATGPTSIAEWARLAEGRVAVKVAAVAERRPGQGRLPPRVDGAGPGRLP